MWKNGIIGMLLLITTTRTFGSWTFEKLPTSLSSNQSAEYVFQYVSYSLEECAAICAQYYSCKSMYLHQDLCFGLSSWSTDSSNHGLVNTYTKRTQACSKTNFLVFNDLCLMISEIKLAWYDAQRYCENKGGHLIVLDTETKHNSCLDFICNFYDDKETNFFVGASDLETEGMWKWIIPNSMNYFKFKTPSQPNNYDHDFPSFSANCGTLVSNTGVLYDEYCSQTKKFICEI
ncbi:C-type lectin domain family 6 member A-like [Mytilus trossulus]|uniref:C-type lectin domain family 6 member A-like n=1 Tax=Mytilus trossulus TaxID=6551 RepID=UPI0030074E54